LILANYERLFVELLRLLPRFNPTHVGVKLFAKDSSSVLVCGGKIAHSGWIPIGFRGDLVEVLPSSAHPIREPP
jgi:hypothetical protein